MTMQRIMGIILLIVSVVLIPLGAGIVCILTVPLAICAIGLKEFTVEDYDDSNY